MPQDNLNDIYENAKRIDRDINKGLYGDLTRPSLTVNVGQRTGAELHKQFSDLLMGPARDHLDRTYKVDMSAYKSALLGTVQPDSMSKFFATHYKTADPANFFPQIQADKSPLVRSYFENVSSRYTTRTSADADSDTEVDAEPAFEEIAEQVSPEVAEEFREDVFTPVAEQLLDELSTEPTDEDVAALQSLAEEMTPEQEEAAERIGDLYPVFKDKRRAVVDKLKKRLSWISDHRLLACVIALIAAAVLYAVLSVFAPGLVEAAGTYMTFSGTFLGIAALALIVTDKKDEAD